MTQPAELPETDVPPNDMDAEGIVLSWSLEHGAVDGLLPVHFYADANRRVYEAILGVLEAGEPLDCVAVARWLRDRGRLLQVGGTPYIGLLAHSIPATANVLSHAAAVREMYRRRVLADAALRLRVEIRSGECPSGEVWERFKQICLDITSDMTT